MTDRPGQELTRYEFDAVIRRAAELAASETDSEEAGLTEAELFRIAGEVGLSDEHVRHALAEVRVGIVDHGPMDRVFGPAFVTASRVVDGERGPIAHQLDEFFVATQLLQRVRRGPGVLQYRPSVDWASQLARAASFRSRKYYVASAKSVEIRLDEVEEGRTFIEMIVDPGTRGETVAGAVLGGGATGMVGGGLAGWLLASVTPVGLAVAVGVLVGAGLSSAVGYAVGQSHKKMLRDVRSELEGLLDALELGESLEPPPASWRRWVKRNFHGVAKDLMRAEDDLGV
jgi:hypothetical protein